MNDTRPISDEAKLIVTIMALAGGTMHRDHLKEEYLRMIRLHGSVAEALKWAQKEYRPS